MTTVMATGTFDLLHPGHGIYLQKSKELGGPDAKIVVVVARDSTVKARKRIPVINENQRLEMIKMLKPVDEAYLGYEGDKFRIVKELKPDIISIGPDQDFDIERFDDQEYMVIANLFELKAQQLEKYLNTRVKQSKTFTDAESDETFKSLVQKVEDIRKYDIEKYRAFIKEAGCSYDKANYIRSLDYVDRIKGIDYAKDMAAYTVYNDGIKMYNESMINVVMIPSVDRSKNTYYMSRTKTGMDYMAKQADDYLATAQETAKEVKLNEDIINEMQNGQNSSADIQKANDMIKDINQKFSDLSKQIETVDKAYVKYKTKDYLTFKTANASLSQKLQPTKLFVIAVGLLMAIYAAFLIKFRYKEGGILK